MIKQNSVQNEEDVSFISRVYDSGHHNNTDLSSFSVLDESANEEDLFQKLDELKDKADNIFDELAHLQKVETSPRAGSPIQKMDSKEHKEIFPNLQPPASPNKLKRSQEEATNINPNTKIQKQPSMLHLQNLTISPEAVLKGRQKTSVIKMINQNTFFCFIDGV